MKQERAAAQRLHQASMKTFELTALTDSIDSPTGLEHAVLQSLLNWSKAQQNDFIENDDSKRGWWANDYVNGVGCRDWTLARAKQNKDTLNRAKLHTEQALDWLVKRNIATDVQVNTFYENDRLIRVITVTLNNNQTQEITL